MTRVALLSLLLASLWASAETVYDYRVLERKPQDRQHFVQGLQIADGMLYISTGLHGQSRLLRYHFEDGELDTERRLHPRLFGEGVTVAGNRVYQLTWRNRMLLVYARDTLRPQRVIRLPGEGWGITWSGEELVYSDGSDRLFFMDADSGRISRTLPVRSGGEPVARLNELEWIDGRVWANVWQSDDIVIIDPDSGEVTARLDLSGLLPDSDRQPGTDVLNGIARNPADGAIWVTGKRWPWLYRIEPVPRDQPDSESTLTQEPTQKQTRKRAL